MANNKHILGGKMTVLQWLAVASWLALGLWVAFPANAFLRPIALQYEDGWFSFTRELKYGTVWGRADMEVRSYLGTCSRTVVIPYEDIGLTPARFPANGVEPCLPMEDGRVFEVEVRRIVFLLGTIPARASISRWSCTVGAPDCISLR